ncbi:hypothetical protein L1987_38214 [Smallanthus sonchifolius]|uniref:Uncharacterized protein n=1 Tax=Smallanthus sonchifolius TaxID=185202 RepID=A0ACB9HIK8_9ASTR|nr:hypothetical protein L1987_38214 [Smallanthus sonchifolius]
MAYSVPASISRAGFQTLFIEEHQDLEKVNDLKKRFIDAAEEAQYILDLFLYEDFSRSLKRDDVRRSFRYLIVIDDIWHTETWDDLKVFFPHDNNGSRILLTTRLNEVAKHANSDGFIHHLGYLSKEKSWDLLCRKVFCGNECPEWSIKPGMQMVENCHGLPLAVAVIAGVLAKGAWSKKFWAEIVERTGSYIVGDQNRCGTGKFVEKGGGGGCSHR